MRERERERMSTTSRHSTNPKRSRSLLITGLSSRTTQAMVDISLYIAKNGVFFVFETHTFFKSIQCEAAVSQFLPMEVSLKSQKGYAFVNFDTVEKL